MEILCPNCQRKLTILEQYAGQALKCPLCGNTFTAPALPPAAPPAAAYNLQPPPAQPPPPLDSPPSKATVPATQPAAGAPPPPEPASTEYTGRFSFWISPRITRYIPAVLMFLVFVLSFFPWVGIRPGGVWLDSQTGWQAAFGSLSSAEKDTEPLSWFKGKQREKALLEPMAGQADGPGWDILAFFYLPFMMLNLVVAVAAFTVPYYQQFVPATAQSYLRFRWSAAAIATLAAFALLFLQDAIGFKLERRASEAVNKVTTKNQEDWTRQQKEGRYPDMEPREIPYEVEIFRGTNQQAIVRTNYYRCVFWFQFWALVFVALTLLAELRAPKPSPRVDVNW